MASTKRVLIIESGCFLGGVINELFAAHADYEVRGIHPLNNGDLSREIESFRPDMLVTDDTTPDEILKTILLFSLRLADLRVVVLCANENRASIYSAQKVETTSWKDFLAVL